MYALLLSLHSLVRWLVLSSLLYTIYRSYMGWLARRPFSKLDNFTRHSTATIAHIQLVIGIWLYFISPVTRYFLAHYSDAVHERQTRFFGMEHSSMMLIAVIIVTIPSSLAKRKPTDKQQFKTMAIGFTIALMIILVSIPWKFSPMASRPYFRPF